MGLLDPQWEAMSHLGLGLLASRSPNFGQAVGEAGLATTNFMRMREMEKARLMEEEQQRRMREMAMQKAQAAEQAQAQMAEQFRQKFPELSDMHQFAPQEAIQRAFREPPKPKIQFAPNGQVVDMNALQPGQSFEKQPDWQNPDYRAWRESLAKKSAPNVTTNVMPPREVFKDSMALKKDFDGQPEVKGFKEVQGAWDQISTALKAPSAANDLAAATKFMKLLDPGSVVRESELMMAMQASGALDRMANYHKRLRTGEKLTPTQREDFFRSGEALYNAAKGRYDQSVGQYEELAGKYQLDPSFLKPKSAAKSGAQANADVSFSGLTATINGKTLTFPSQAALNAFKKQAGL